MISRQFIRYAAIGLILNVIAVRRLSAADPRLMGSSRRDDGDICAGVLIGFALEPKYHLQLSREKSYCALRDTSRSMSPAMRSISLYLWLLVGQVGVPHEIVQGGVTFALPLLLFILQKYWVFSVHPASGSSRSLWVLCHDDPYPFQQAMHRRAGAVLCWSGRCRRPCQRRRPVHTACPKAHARTASALHRVLLHHLLHGGPRNGCLPVRLGPNDEVILPSYTFASTANAVVLRGATPVFVDIRPDTLNIDEAMIEAAITPRTRAIFLVHYAGVACEMDEIMAIARRHDLLGG